MPIWQLCANLLIPNCLRSNLSYFPLAALELYVNESKTKFDKIEGEMLSDNQNDKECYFDDGIVVLYIGYGIENGKYYATLAYISKKLMNQKNEDAYNPQIRN